MKFIARQCFLQDTVLATVVSQLPSFLMKRSYVVTERMVPTRAALIGAARCEIRTYDALLTRRIWNIVNTIWSFLDESKKTFHQVVASVSAQFRLSSKFGGVAGCK
jgi:hypothetical protein